MIKVYSLTCLRCTFNASRIDTSEKFGSPTCRMKYPVNVTVLNVHNAQSTCRFLNTRTTQYESVHHRRTVSVHVQWVAERENIHMSHRVQFTHECPYPLIILQIN